MKQILVLGRENSRTAKIISSAENFVLDTGGRKPHTVFNCGFQGKLWLIV